MSLTRTPTAAEIDSALERADAAFWASIVADFPEATSGDLDPDVSARFDMVALATVKRWLDLNMPRHTYLAKLYIRSTVDDLTDADLAAFVSPLTHTSAGRPHAIQASEVVMVDLIEVVPTVFDAKVADLAGGE